MDYAAATSLPLGIGGVLIYVKPLYRSSHREFNKTQIKRFRHSVRLCLFCTFFVVVLGEILIFLYIT